MSRHIVSCLNPFRKPDCKVGFIKKSDDFKHLARKVRLYPFFYMYINFCLDVL